MTAAKIFARTEKALSNQRVTEKKEHRDVGHAAAKTSDKRPRDQGIWSRIQPRGFTPNERKHIKSKYSNPRDGQQAHNKGNPQKHRGPHKRQEEQAEAWREQQVIFPRIKGGPTQKRPLISFPVTLTDGKHERTEMIDFLVLPVNSKHNMILGRVTLATFNAIPSTVHGVIGFPTPTGIAIIWSDRECATTEGFRPAKSLKPSEAPMPEKWGLNPNFPEQPITIGTTISHSTREHLKQLLIKYADVFAWQPSDMQGVPRSMMEHRLQTYKAIEPIAQKRRNMGGERSKDLEKQVKELLKAGIIREVRYQTWVANLVMIQMAVEDEDKTAFRTNIGIFCYTKMPFGLKNAGATY
ncbi:hypothetical protein L1987_60861 [Smallanthus sonchifolius]|uniref:Uncharacterized protein n=1 Tax=Smallanthus sonchifolius TaxID=185202 RepID=A0ACB9DA48_9ASTR|nr:hypothetical protein L1987_60861 [Smallanthus sonchifolius]